MSTELDKNQDLGPPRPVQHRSPTGSCRKSHLLPTDFFKTMCIQSLFTHNCFTFPTPSLRLMCPPPPAQRGELDAAKRALIDYPLSRFSDFFLSDLASHWKNRHPTEREGRERWRGGGIILNSLWECGKIAPWKGNSSPFNSMPTKHPFG